jgi:subtilisin family serine protease
VSGGHVQRYLIALRSQLGFAAPRADALDEALAQMDGVEVVRHLRPKGFKGIGTAVRSAQDVIVVRMDEPRAEALRQSAQAQVIVELDAPLGVGQATLPIPFAAPWSSRVTPAPRRRADISFRVLGRGDQPLAGAGITVFGRRFSAQAITDSSGAASVTFLDAEADLEDVRAVYVQPAADHWECFLHQPALASSEPNVVKLNPLVPTSANSADDERAARERDWGRKLMRLDRSADAPSGGPVGGGVKIGLIDSGCDVSHPLLRHVTRGVDLSRREGPNGWMRDEIGQGTHCAGLIAGAGGSPPGVSGIVPGAEIHVFKLSPGGHFSDLIEALDQCIERQIDIVCLGVGSDQVSELVVRKLAEARLAGIACIAAAGDEGGPVRFPAMVPGVLSVSAIGMLGEFPAETHHGWTALPELIGPAGLFATNFSSVGRQIGVCAPGVAIISSVPGGGLAARDGTAIAAAHVTGFAAVVLARHPLFRGAYRSRGEQRVQALFELVAASAVPPVFDPARVGAGLPDLERVPGLGAGDVGRRSHAAQDLGAFAYAAGKDPYGERLASTGVVPPQAYGGDASALMQLRAAGLI